MYKLLAFCISIEPTQGIYTQLLLMEQCNAISKSPVLDQCLYAGPKQGLKFTLKCIISHQILTNSMSKGQVCQNVYCIAIHVLCHSKSDGKLSFQNLVKLGNILMVTSGLTTVQEGRVPFTSCCGFGLRGQKSQVYKCIITVIQLLHIPML